MKYLNEMWKANIFFWRESKSYISPWKFRNYIYSPMAWLKFMGLTHKHLIS